MVRQVIGTLKGWLIAQILREENAKVDELARLSSSSEADLCGIRMEYLPESSIRPWRGMEVDEVNLGPSWMDPITTSLTTRELPFDKVKARRIRYKVVKYHIVEGVIYKKEYTLSYLRSVYISPVNHLFYEIYEGTYYSHIGGMGTVNKSSHSVILLANNGLGLH